MRRKILKVLLGLLFLFLFLGGVYAFWTWYQMRIGQSLQSGVAQTGSAWGGLIVPQTAVFYAVLAGAFLLLAIVSIWLTYRYLMFPPAANGTDVSDEA